MKLRVAAACLAAFASTLPAGTANAHLDACAGAGTLSTDQGLYYLPDYRFNVGWVAVLPGACAASGLRSATMHGTFSQATCDSSIGYAEVDGHAAAGSSAGGVWFIIGGAVGAFLVIPQGSCLNDGTNPGASSFLLVGAFATV